MSNPFDQFGVAPPPPPVPPSGYGAGLPYGSQPAPPGPYGQPPSMYSGGGMGGPPPPTGLYGQASLGDLSLGSSPYGSGGAAGGPPPPVGGAMVAPVDPWAGGAPAPPPQQPTSLYPPSSYSAGPTTPSRDMGGSMYSLPADTASVYSSQPPTQGSQYLPPDQQQPMYNSQPPVLNQSGPPSSQQYPQDSQAMYGQPPAALQGVPSQPYGQPSSGMQDQQSVYSQPSTLGQQGLAQPPSYSMPPVLQDSQSLYSQPPMVQGGGPPPQPPAPYQVPGSSMYEPNYGQPQAPVPSQGFANPYGMPSSSSDSASSAMLGAIVPSQQPSNPYALGPPPPYGVAPQPSPYGPSQPYGQQPPPQYGQPPQPNPYGAPYGAAPPPPASVDPFSVFEAKQSQMQQSQQQLVTYSQPPPQYHAGALVPVAAAPVASDDEFWGAFSAQQAPSSVVTSSSSTTDQVTKETSLSIREEKKGEDGLPPGGEWYDAKIFTPTLGVMFFKPQELTDSLFLKADRAIVDALGDRPVVAFIVEGSSARSAGVELGHVLLKVNDVDVRTPKDASRLIKEGPRPLPLLFYVPNIEVVTAEGEHMVKYDTKDTMAPNSAKEWKPKYVVIGGIIAQPWMINMYRSKSEYDIAVIETQARRPVSVKVKQFSLQGARIQNDWQGPQMVKYKNQLHPWKYIVVLPVARNPIKISSPSLGALKPVHEGIRRVLVAQQRQRGGDPGRPPEDSYRSGGSSGEAQSQSSSQGSYGQQPQQQQFRY